ncbi:hypothetical protein RI367_001172 [Sorochytrium milnesiophthora]
MSATAATLPIVLGSSSKFRRRIIHEHYPHSDIECVSPDIDEKAIGDRSAAADPEQLVLAVAQAKADALLGRMQRQCILITSDQVTVHNGVIREKPRDIQVTAVVVTNTRTGKQAAGVDRAKQHFHRIPEDIVQQVLDKGETMHCAGGFMIDEPMLYPYLGQREGDEDSIIGMPMKLTQQLIERVTSSS